MLNFFFHRASALVIAMALPIVGMAAPLRIELPPEAPAFKPAAGAELAMGQCLICHSSEYITTQPLLSPAAWKATVEKMQHKFGAPLPADQVDALVDYLVRGYGAPAVEKAGADATAKAPASQGAGPK